MIKLERPPVPQWLEDNYEKWGRNYQNKRADPNKKNKFELSTAAFIPLIVP